MSESSTLSNITVSFFGEEMDLEKAVDQVFKDLQLHLNDSHMQVRQLGMLSEQDNDFKVAYELYVAIDDDVTQITNLMKELRSVAKQVLGPVPKAEREWYKEQQEKRKQKLAADKAADKLAASTLDTVKE